MATFTGFMRPIFAKFCNLTGAFFMTLFTVLEHFLMFFVRERHFAHGRRQVNDVGSEGCSGKSNQSDQSYDYFRQFYLRPCLISDHIL
jgi:hypothetical protein